MKSSSALEGVDALSVSKLRAGRLFGAAVTHHDLALASVLDVLERQDADVFSTEFAGLRIDDELARSLADHRLILGQRDVREVGGSVEDTRRDLCSPPHERLQDVQLNGREALTHPAVPLDRAGDVGIVVELDGHECLLAGDTLERRNPGDSVRDHRELHGWHGLRVAERHEVDLHVLLLSRDAGFRRLGLLLRLVLHAKFAEHSSRELAHARVALLHVIPKRFRVLLGTDGVARTIESAARRRLILLHL